MAITLQRLCEKSDYLYGMRVLAGESGMNTPVQWVHAIEDMDAGAFLHGGELIFTTGIAGGEGCWLLSFVKKIRENKAAGLVVNVGPYISKVPSEVYEYCNENGFPLLEVPWKTRLVDITRDFCNQIIKDEKEVQEIGELFLQLIYSEQDRHVIAEKLKQYSFAPYDSYCAIAIDINGSEELLQKLEGSMKSAPGRKVFIHGKEHFILILNGCENSEVEYNVEQLKNFLKKESVNSGWYMGVSKNEENILKLYSNFRKASGTLKLAKNRNVPILYYNSLDMEKIFFSIEESGELEEYYKKILGRLEKYDREHESEYMELLKKYILYDGSIGRMAEVINVHRNTINYQMNKVKKILENDMNKLEDRFQIIMALKIKEVL